MNELIISQKNKITNIPRCCKKSQTANPLLFDFGTHFFFCQKQIENQSDRKFISHVSTLIFFKLSNVLSRNCTCEDIYDLQTTSSKFSVLSFAWCAKIVTGTRVPYGCKNLTGNPVRCACVSAQCLCTYILIRHYNTYGISRISFRVVRNMMLPLECSFRTISILLTLTCGRFCSVGHALQGRTSTDTQRPRRFPRNQPDRYFQ